MKRKNTFIIMLICSLVCAEMCFELPIKAKKKEKTETITVYRGKTKSLMVKKKGKKIPAGKKFSYRVSNKKIISVSKRGKVKGKKAGVARVTMMRHFDGKKYRVKVKVLDYVKELRLNFATNFSMMQGEKRILTPVVYPKTASNRKVTYNSSNTKVVTVNTNGEIQARGCGSAIITIKTKGKTKKKKKIIKRVYIYVKGGFSVPKETAIPTPHLPDSGGSLMEDQTTEGELLKPEETLADAIVAIPAPDASTLLAAKMAVIDESGKVSTLYFVNRSYVGNMCVKIDKMELSTSRSVAQVLQLLSEEVTGEGITVSINPGNKQENKYYDSTLGLWRDSLVAMRPKVTDAWLITNRKNGKEYRLSAWVKDTKYKTPYGLIVTEGNTLKEIEVQG